MIFSERRVTIGTMVISPLLFHCARFRLAELEDEVVTSAAGDSEEVIWSPPVFKASPSPLALSSVRRSSVVCEIV